MTTTQPDEFSRSGYWYPEGDSAQTIDVLNMLRRYRAAETAMRARTRATMGMNETDLMALRFLLHEQRAGRIVRPIDLARVLDISTASTTTLIDRLASEYAAARQRIGAGSPLVNASWGRRAAA